MVTRAVPSLHFRPLDSRASRMMAAMSRFNLLPGWSSEMARRTTSTISSSATLPLEALFLRASVPMGRCSTISRSSHSCPPTAVPSATRARSWLSKAAIPEPPIAIFNRTVPSFRQRTRLVAPGPNGRVRPAVLAFRQRPGRFVHDRGIAAKGTLGVCLCVGPRHADARAHQRVDARRSRGKRSYATAISGDGRFVAFDSNADQSGGRRYKWIWRRLRARSFRPESRNASV